MDSARNRASLLRVDLPRRCWSGPAQPAPGPSPDAAPVVALEVQALPGDATRPVLVFLHEGLGSVSMWAGRDGSWPASVCTTTGCPGLVYSRRGYGRSDPIPDVRGAGRLPPDYLHREAFGVLPALLARLGIVRPVLIGHSDGGSIALLHASRHPVTGCVVMAPHLMVERQSIESIEQARAAYEGGALRARLTRHHADVDSAFWQWNDVWLSAAFRSFDIRPDCRRIQAPVLAIQGREDPYGSLRQIEEIAPTAGRFELAVVERCGHSPHKDHAPQVRELVADFVRRLT